MQKITARGFTPAKIKRPSGTVLALICGGGFAVSASTVQAIDIGLSLYEESEYTTNAGLTERDEVEDWSHAPGASFQASHDGPTLNLDVDYSYERRFYEEDLFDDENVSAGSANLLWNALPERLDFTVSHTRSQSTIRSIDAPTPDNRQETMDTTAGPLLRFQPRGQDEIQFEYQYGDRTSDQTENDSTTHDITARYLLALSEINSLTLEVMNNQVQYDSSFFPDIEYRIAQLVWDRSASNIDYSLTAGYTRAKRKQVQSNVPGIVVPDLDDVDGFIFNASVDWQARPGTTVSFTAARDINDQSANQNTGEFADDGDFSVNSGFGSVFTNDSAGIAINQRLGGRTTLDLSATYDKEDYEDLPSDTESVDFSLGLNRRLTPNLTLSVGASVGHQDFSDQDDESDTLSGDASLDWAVGRRLSLRFGVGYEERDDDSGLSTRSYDAWTGTLRVTYTAIGAAQ